MNNKKVNELGEKSSEEKYVCRTCRREVTKNVAGREGWYYCIKRGENMGGGIMQYFNSDDVEYVCSEHYRTLSDKESLKFVAMGYPYYSSLLALNQNITTF